MIGNRASLLIGTLLLAGLSAVAAQAQERPYRPTGTRISQEPERANPNAARELMKSTARCVYRRHEAAALEFLRVTDPVNAPLSVLGDSYDAIEGRLTIGECMGEATSLEQTQSYMAVQSRALRASLAEEAYLARQQVPLVLPADAPEILDTRFFRAGDLEVQARGLAAFADCVVYHAPTEADALARAAVGSDNERARARALVPAISQCLVEGQEANLTTGGIREMVADGLWSRTEYGATALSGE